ncbi:MAG: phosphomethylpyrimidine synthase ThiC [bacterium]|nr:phosphomethylpyrimidine synthase ThiC [bacterium]
MPTQIELARDGNISDEMERVAVDENLPVEEIRENIAQGRLIIPNNLNRKSKVVGIGRGLRTKVNASIGTSTDIVDPDMEAAKARTAEENGADTLMELSTGGDLDRIRQTILAGVNLPVGSVPLYQAFLYAIKQKGSALKMDPEYLFEVIEKQCEDGISFMAIHCGINRITLERLKRQGYRHGGLVSRGGAYMSAWMIENNRENPLYEHFDRVVEILRKHDVVLSLGNGLRAGAVEDSSDRAQIQELIINCELAQIGQDMGCQMMVEGPGHIPIDEIEANVILQKRMSRGAPFYMLGPLPTDIAAGYDHISAAVGASLSSAFGADFICYVTPPEHLALPAPEDVKVGLAAAKIAAHIGDMIKRKDRDRDRRMSHARRKLDWEEQFRVCLFPQQAASIRDSRSPSNTKTCTMCGDSCALNIVDHYFSPYLSEDKKG